MSAVQQEGLLFPSMIDQKDFLRFALFDTFRIKKRWKTPVLFACIMSASAAVCFALRQSREQASLLGGVLLGIGLILPIVWYLLFLSSIRNEARKLGLSKVKAAYSLLLLMTVSLSCGKTKRPNTPGKASTWPGVSKAVSFSTFYRPGTS